MKRPTTRERKPTITGAQRTADGAGIDDRHASLMHLYRVSRAHSGGGDLFTKHVSDPLGSWIAAIAIRFGIQPSVVTLADLLLALSATAVVVSHADQAHQWWLPGLVAFVLWQLAYVLDCADGQVARATGKQSDFGARVDVLVDFFVHGAIICSLIAVTARWSDSSVALLAACAVLWPVNLLIGVLARTDGNIGHSFTRRGGIVAIIKLGRDTGFILFVTGTWLLIAPRSILFLVVAITVFNAFFLLASIGREAYLSMRRT
ncbi:MAG: CDP-alcohol phosphatidyltransferase family protein [Pseudonocardiaceae bacterium]